MAYDTAVMAGGIRFYLVGRTAYPTGTVVHKFQNAMIAARTKLASAIAAISSNPLNLTQRQDLVLEYCFNPNALQRAATVETVKGVLNATLTGLRTADLMIREPDLTAIPANAEGYVAALGPFRGDIHTRFDLSDARTLNNIIHEATHKFARTVDNGYMANSIGNFLHVRLLGIMGNSPMSNVLGLTNADSYSAFAVNMT